jgi:hypothetical protein
MCSTCGKSVSGLCTHMRQTWLLPTANHLDRTSYVHTRRFTRSTPHTFYTWFSAVKMYGLYLVEQLLYPVSTAPIRRTIQVN